LLSRPLQVGADASIGLGLCSVELVDPVK
jgi:hypothetical protein